jgi:putative Mg2+ transporter-C (MgtC) family protein
VIGASAPNNANIPQGVITGVGFIGAGATMRQGDITTGIDTAASVWTVGVMGAAVGYGYYDIRIILAVANFAVLMLRAPSPGHSSAPESPPGNTNLLRGTRWGGIHGCKSLIPPLSPAAPIWALLKK